MLINEAMGAMTRGLPMAGAPQLSLTVSDSLQTLFRGISLVLVGFLLIMLLVKNINFGRGGMGANKIKPMTIIACLLLAAMLMDVQLFVTGLNWVMNILFEIGTLVGDWFKSTPASGGGGGSVDIS